MEGPNWKLNDDRQTVTLTFPSTPPVALQLMVQQIEDLFLNLGHFRANMLPPVEADFALDQKVAAVSDLRWFTEPDALLGQSLLDLRDPRFGWLHYLLPKESALSLGKILQAQGESLPPGLGADKPN
jgi:hypothetical protein